ncbi:MULTISPECIES: hypothetical protein [Carnobacterium]|uniref:Transcriptional regulator n=1 Tax=Carnobacterium antarcticum TaxID=2126436 RepID=A0ABW4NMN4_9LACT|nr:MULTISPECIES: hypothetical protein [unclassified Carnobacterium]ALV21048.1 hypothetical protein NY10_428 [Carnobacterium sp. CP1]QQP71198.1 hypothetical protein JHE06_05355 [Carnobacterium sp. CS13]
MEYTDEELEVMLFSYRQLEAQLNKIRLNILSPYRISDSNIGGGRSSFVSNPTEMTAVRLSDDEEILRIKQKGIAIENTYASLTSDKQKMMMVYYIDPNPLKRDKHIADQLHIDRSTLWRWRTMVVNVFRNELDKQETRELRTLIPSSDKN